MSEEDISWLELAEVEDYPPALRNIHENVSNKVFTFVVEVEDPFSTRSENMNYIRKTLSQFTRIRGILHRTLNTYIVKLYGKYLPEYIPYLNVEIWRDNVDEAEDLDRELERYQMSEALSGARWLDQDLENYFKGRTTNGRPPLRSGAEIENRDKFLKFAEDRYSRSDEPSLKPPSKGKGKEVMKKKITKIPSKILETYIERIQESLYPDVKMDPKDLKKLSKVINELIHCSLQRK